MKHALVVACFAVAVSPLLAKDSDWRNDLRAFREGGPGERAVAAGRLAACRDPAALEEILAVLDDADFHTREPLRQAVLAIGALADARTALDAIVGASEKARDTAALLLAGELGSGRTRRSASD